MKKKYFIQNNTIKINPKTTEILHLFVTQTKKPPQLYPKKIKCPSTMGKLKAHRPKINSGSFPPPFNDESLLLDQCLNYPSKVKLLNDDLKKSNIEQIKQLILPSIANSFQSIDFIQMKFSSPVTHYKISSIAKEVSANKFESPKYHEIRSNFFIKDVINKNKKTLATIKKAITDTRTPEEKEEAYDSFVSESLAMIKLKRLIRNFLGAKDNKLNQIVIEKEKFFDSLENKVNFIYDIYKVPNFKNNFINYTNKMDSLNQYKNIIDTGINKYLNLLKYSIQKEKDNRKNHIENEKEQEEKRKLKKLLNEDPDDEVNFLRSRDKDNNKLLYEIDNFFIHKYVKYQNVNFANDKVKKCIFNKNQK